MTTRADWLAAVLADGATLVPDLSVGSGALPDLGPSGISLPVSDGAPAYGVPGPDASWTAVGFDGNDAFTSSNAAAVGWGAPTSITIEAIVKPTGTVGDSLFVLSDSFSEDTATSGDGVFLSLVPPAPVEPLFTLNGQGAGLGQALGNRSSSYGEWIYVAGAFDAAAVRSLVTLHGCPSGDLDSGLSRGLVWHASRRISLGAQVKGGFRSGRFFVGSIAGLAMTPHALDLETLREHAEAAGLARSCGGWSIGQIAVS